ncbi:hypothetical protein PVAND_005372 [Polypedilum vanderplanki]|uniref:Uncharacterized protein n=1 Tax=Polypedilum vanderplanki TaxID=319348 RepID=A0A9J6C078_POLVA|nr:hypothetical protein PVAND_005372 [Polypedilum vanderplanki]
MHEKEFFILYASYGIFLVITIFIYLKIYWKRRKNLRDRENEQRRRNDLPIYTISNNSQQINDRLPSYFDLYAVENPPDYKDAIKGKMLEV